jgi:hypothetical protein
VVGKPEERKLSEGISIDGRIILKWIKRKVGWSMWIGFM